MATAAIDLRSMPGRWEVECWKLRMDGRIIAGDVPELRVVKLFQRYSPSFQGLFGYRIVPAPAPRMTATNALEGQPAPGHCAVRTDGLHRVTRAGGGEATACVRTKNEAQQRRQRQPIQAETKNQNGLKRIHIILSTTLLFSKRPKILFQPCHKSGRQSTAAQRAPDPQVASGRFDAGGMSLATNAARGFAEPRHRPCR